MCSCNMLPCHRDNTNSKYYKGKKNILNNKCKKCEFVNSLAYFMLKNYSGYALEKCCDVESSEGKEPEAVFINRDNIKDKIAIEVKSFHQIFNADIIKDDKERSRQKRFTEKILNDIGNNVYIKVDKILKESNIVLIPELSDLFLYGLLLTVYRDTVYEEKHGIKHAISKPIADEFLSYRGKKEQKLIEEITEQVVKYIVDNIFVCFKGETKKYRRYHEFKIDNLNFQIGKSKRDSKFSIAYRERGGTSNFYPPREAFDNRINEYFKDCKDKFSGYMISEYKRVLLITNESNYFKDNIVEKLKKFEKPKHIDEVWCSFYVCEEIWNDELEDFYGERIVDIDYVKVL